MGRQKPVRIIIAEDDFLVGKEIHRVLEGLGHQIIADVSNGSDAVEKTCQLRPDVVLMDIQMPGMDGLQAARRIQRRCPTPVVVLSAYESSDLYERASNNGVGAYVVKPPKASEIERAIIIALSRHKDLIKLRHHNERLEKALSGIRTLRGILPICVGCKKIRDDKGYWNIVENYIRAHSEAEFSHSICPECIKKFYPDITIDES
ncbi:MAG: response regulator [Desulfobacteraceae bacterium]|jgi:AmiR/NasT family two-component response regulator